MTETQPAWYCIKTRPRQERVAKRGLQTHVGIEVFCPLLGFERVRRSGKVRVVEAMFPGYLFAKFSYAEHRRHVGSTNGVCTVVSFGGVPAIVADEILAELRASVSDGETIEIPTKIKIGEEVQIVEGPLRGLRAMVTRVLPARARVTVLLELLGMNREVEFEEQSVMPDIKHPLAGF